VGGGRIGWVALQVALQELRTGDRVALVLFGNSALTTTCDIHTEQSTSSKPKSERYLTSLVIRISRLLMILPNPPTKAPKCHRSYFGHRSRWSVQPLYRPSRVRLSRIE